VKNTQPKPPEARTRVLAFLFIKKDILCLFLI